uniref:Uncharacterized protein n=1 Tax=Vitis vinifera TaxID=29760 RepID=A5BFS8_VITVI|nr:hypothetical protein VITISV_025924 [Vitis vinifera]
MAPFDSRFGPRQRRHLIRAQLVSQLIRVQLRSSLRHVSGSFRRNSIALYKKAAKFSQQKADFATLWSDLLAMAVTPSFQLRIVHRLKNWILDFLSFDMCSFLAYFERLWQRAMELQSLVLHEFELFIALPWIPNNSPHS